MATNERMERFRRDVGEMRLKAGKDRREAVFQALGAAMMVIGIVVGLITYEASLNQSDVRDVESSVILAVVMLGLAVAGAVLFATFTVTRFLRLWLLRQLYEGQAHVDEVVEALVPTEPSPGRAPRPVPGNGADGDAPGPTISGVVSPR